MPIDAYLEIIDKANPVKGEVNDREFKKKSAIGLRSFRLLPSSEPILPLTKQEQELEEEGLRPPPPPSFRFTITKEVDWATPDLFLAYCRYVPPHFEAFAEGLVTVRKSGGPGLITYLVFRFKNLYVSDYGISLDSAEELPEETVTFNFETCEVEYRKQQTEGTTRGRGNAKYYTFNKTSTNSSRR